MKTRTGLSWLGGLWTLGLATVLGAACIAGCDVKEGPVEEAGEAVDSAADKADDAMDDATDN